MPLFHLQSLSSRHGKKPCLQSSSSMPNIRGTTRIPSDASAAFCLVHSNSERVHKSEQHVNEVQDCPDSDNNSAASAVTPGSAKSPGRKCERKTLKAKEVVTGVHLSMPRLKGRVQEVPSRARGRLRGFRTPQNTSRAAIYCSQACSQLPGASHG